MWLTPELSPVLCQVIRLHNGKEKPSRKRGCFSFDKVHRFLQLRHTKSPCIAVPGEDQEGALDDALSSSIPSHLKELKPTIQDLLMTTCLLSASPVNGN